ncbi:hypothetical protein PILCRDRAFT_27976, partial [Piloderma croceum F 1598]
IIALAGQMNAQFTIINQQFNRLAAQTSNSCILVFNHLLPVGMGYQPLVKETPGSGIGLAVQLNPPWKPTSPTVGNPTPSAALGQVPPFHNVNINSYHHRDILRFIKFYNDSFGIVFGDEL